jgi:hypothetical protein
LGFFTGVIFCATAIGTTTWLRAGNDHVITACANKKTGVMRFSKNGSCNRKTENVVSWNASGVAGPAGPIGATGPKGETGPPGSTPQTSDALFVFDVAGNKLGQLIDIQLVDYSYDSFTIATGDNYYVATSIGTAPGKVYFSEPNCVGTPFMLGDISNFELPKQYLITVPALNEHRVRFFAWQESRPAASKLSVRSILTDQYPSESELEGTFDGIGSCTNTESPRSIRARVLTEVQSPVAWDTSGPLRIGTDK